MPPKLALFALTTVVALFSAGCAGPQKKLGRGVTNLTEFARLGEMQRSIEQTALFEGDTAYASGLIRGINRSMARTVVGLYEVVTFPIPSYDPILRPGGPILPDATVGPPFPDSHQPGLIADSIFDTDTNLGFNGGDRAPFVPGSRFRVLDY